jgi:hypothetical protein
VYVKDGKRYGVTASYIWRERWWNYYERGLSYADGEFWDDAIADLQQAVQQRGEDQRRARTYGLHFIDYFPHRELGIVYYHLQRYPDAIHELETSLRSTATAKAKFYLNKARQRQIEQTQSDTAAPRIAVHSPSDGLLTNRFTVLVEGQVTDDTYVSAIAINGAKQFMELATPRQTFQQQLPLQDGANTIDIVAVDLVGKSTRQQLTVTLDRHGPVLSLERVERRGTPPHQRVRLHAWLSDSSKVVRFALAGRQIPLSPEQDYAIHEDIPFPSGMIGLPFEAEDAAGNTTRGTIALEPDAFVPVRDGQTISPATIRWAALDVAPVIADLAFAQTPPAWMAQQRTLPPPSITLTDLPAQPITYYDTVYLEGHATGSSPLLALTVNGVSLWRRAGYQLFFGYSAALQPGDNHFVLEAMDQAGQRTRREVVIHRRVEEVKRLEARWRVTLLPLQPKGEAAALVGAVYDALLTALIDQGRFQFIEREHLEASLQEQKISRSALVEPETAVQLGKMVGAEGLLLGTVTLTPRALEVFTHVVDVETATILAAEDVYGEELELHAVRALMEGLALQIRQQFPLVQGHVLQVQGTQVLVDLGTQQLKKHMKLLVFRDHRPPFGEVKVEAVFAALSLGVFRPASNAAEVQQLDSVMTK